MKEEKGLLKSYVTGFILSIVLTLVVYYFVTQHIQGHHILFRHEFLIPFIVLLGFAQMLVQLFFFLHLGKKGQSPLNMIILICFVSTVIIIVVASIWIMQHLNYNMSLIRLDRVMNQGEGF